MSRSRNGEVAAGAGFDSCRARTWQRYRKRFRRELGRAGFGFYSVTTSASRGTTTTGTPACLTTCWETLPRSKRPMGPRP